MEFSVIPAMEIPLLIDEPRTEVFPIHLLFRFLSRIIPEYRMVRLLTSASLFYVAIYDLAICLGIRYLYVRNTGYKYKKDGLI